MNLMMGILGVLVTAVVISFGIILWTLVIWSFQVDFWYGLVAFLIATALFRNHITIRRAK